MPGSAKSVALFRRCRFADLVDLAERANDQAAARDGWRGHAHFVQAILAEELELRTGLDDVSVAVFAQAENLAVGSPWRRGERGGAAANAYFAVDFLAGFR